MDFSVIKRLCLKEAFHDNKKFMAVVSDLDYLDALFEYSNRTQAFIYDDLDTGYSTFVYNTKRLGSDKTFKIKNPHHKDVFLWRIDGVLYSKDSKCDCAFLTENLLGFVEFKSNAANSSEKAINDNYDKARRQLSITYKDIDDRCRKVGINLRKALNLDAYAVFNRTVPGNNAHQKTQIAKFLMENKFKLHFEDSATI